MKLNKPKQFYLRHQEEPHPEPQITFRAGINNFISFEPMRQNRFIVEFSEELNIVPYVVKSINGLRYVDGQWQNIEIEFYSEVENDLNRTLFNLIDSADLVNNISINFKIGQLDPTGILVDSWHIRGYITSVDWGRLDYGSNELSSVKVVITPQSVIFN